MLKTQVGSLELQNSRLHYFPVGAALREAVLQEVVMVANTEHQPVVLHWDGLEVTAIPDKSTVDSLIRKLQSAEETKGRATSADASNALFDLCSLSGLPNITDPKAVLQWVREFAHAVDSQPRLDTVQAAFENASRHFKSYANIADGYKSADSDTREELITQLERTPGRRDAIRGLVGCLLAETEISIEQQTNVGIPNFYVIADVAETISKKPTSKIEPQI